MRPLESLFVIALLCYSLAIWSHKATHALRAWMVWIFGAGLAADVGGTIFLCATASARLTPTLHTVSGFISILIMALHFSWALIAFMTQGKYEAYFDRFSVYAWCLWLVAFCSGIPIRSTGP